MSSGRGGLHVDRGVLPERPQDLWSSRLTLFTSTENLELQIKWILEVSDRQLVTSIGFLRWAALRSSAAAIVIRTAKWDRCLTTSDSVARSADGLKGHTLIEASETRAQYVY